MKTHFYTLLCTAFLALQGDSLFGAELIQVKDGAPRAEIVLAEKPPRMTMPAAFELRLFIEKMSGARLPIVDRADRVDSREYPHQPEPGHGPTLQQDGRAARWRQSHTRAPWFFNVDCKHDLDGGKVEVLAFSPTGGGWNMPAKFGELVVERVQ